MEKIIKSNKFKIAAGIIGAIVILLASFSLGLIVGFKKAKYSYRWGENYERNFIGPRHEKPGFMPGMPMMPGKDFRNAHGLAGSIISIADKNLVIKDRDGKENTVSVTDKTIIRRFRDTLQFSDLKNGDRIVVLGEPKDDGTVEADLIRVFE